MVRGGRQPVITKSQNVRKSSGRAIAQASPKPATSCEPHKAPPLAFVPSCCGCGKIVTEDVHALQCDRCMSATAWKCAECLNLSDDLYECLVSGTNVAIRWFCENCDKVVMAKSNATESQNNKIDRLIAVIEKLVSRYEDIERKLESKCSVDEVSKLDTKIKQLEDKMLKHDSDMEKKLSELEDHFKENKAGDNTDKENAISDEDMIKFVVHEEINRKTAEEQDVERRKRNIIIYRIPEKKMDNVTERELSDTVYVKDLLDCVFNMKVEEQDLDKMYRLGRWSEDKARPLLVAFKTVEMKEIVMANLRSLKHTVDKFKGVSISNDLHPKEREEIKAMIVEAKREHITSCTEQVENYRFLVVGKGQRKKVIKIKKQEIG